MRELDYYTILCARSQGARDDLALYAAEQNNRQGSGQPRRLIGRAVAGVEWLALSVLQLFRASWPQGIHQILKIQ
jgi:hypothetical protein